MKWTSRYTRQWRKRRERAKWRRWFAWYPVTPNEYTVWLQWVERRTYYPYSYTAVDSYKEYRIPESET